MRRTLRAVRRPRLAESPRAQAIVADLAHRAWEAAGRVGTVGVRARKARRFGALGTGSAIGFPPGPCFGERWVRIGEGTMVGPGVSLAVGMTPDEPLEPPHGWVVLIGDRCNIGRNSSIVARHRVEIGDDVTTGPNVYITDHNHSYDDPDLPIGLQWPAVAPVRIGSGSWLAAGCVILPGADIGRNVVVAAGSVVRGVVPDHAVVAGVPGKVVRRLVDGEWDPPARSAETPQPPPPDDWPR
jgi:acetyltransferase-like isoleucine patch superfamily enzyme